MASNLRDTDRERHGYGSLHRRPLAVISRGWAAGSWAGTPSCMVPVALVPPVTVCQTHSTTRVRWRAGHDEHRCRRGAIIRLADMSPSVARYQ